MTEELSEKKNQLVDESMKHNNDKEEVSPKHDPDSKERPKEKKVMPINSTGHESSSVDAENISSSARKEKEESKDE